MTTEYMVELKMVTKRFRTQVALDAVSVQFAKGKIHGVIGRNGSGKTVMFKCICGLMKPDAGEILVAGKPVKVSAPQNIGIIIENPGFVGNMSGYQNLKMLASIRGSISDERIKESIRMVGLDPADRKHVSKYSLGMHHRLGIAQAIMETPPLLILDEPMNGLDRQGVADIRKLFLKLKEQGTTILISSHYVEDVDLLCDTVCEMDQGKLTMLQPG